MILKAKHSSYFEISYWTHGRAKGVCFEYWQYSEKFYNIILYKNDQLDTKEQLINLQQNYENPVWTIHVEVFIVINKDVINILGYCLFGTHPGSFHLHRKVKSQHDILSPLKYFESFKYSIHYQDLPSPENVDLPILMPNQWIRRSI